VSTTPTRTWAWSRTWTRVLALTFALLVPGAHGTAHAGLAITVSSESAAAEYDLVETAPRPPSRHTHRPSATNLPAPVTPRSHPPAARLPFPAPPRPRASLPYTPHTLRSVILRC
jgi:hypothetical protein